MLRVLGGIWDIVRELLLALIGQPSRPGPTRLEREAYLVKHRNLRRNLRKQASAWEAAEQIGLEAGKVAIMQPTPSPVESSPVEIKPVEIKDDAPAARRRWFNFSRKR